MTVHRRELLDVASATGIASADLPTSGSERTPVADAPTLAYDTFVGGVGT